MSMIRHIYILEGSTGVPDAGAYSWDDYEVQAAMDWQDLVSNFVCGM